MPHRIAYAQAICKPFERRFAVHSVHSHYASLSLYAILDALRPPSSFERLPVLYLRQCQPLAPSSKFQPYLGEADVVRLLAEALTADVQAILADETGLVCADTAADMSAHATPRTSHLPPSPSRSRPARDIPSSCSLAVAAWARVPDRFVRHVRGCSRASVMMVEAVWYVR